MQIVEKIWTHADLLQEFPKEIRLELINNEIFMPPAPSFEHQEISGDLGFILQTFVKKNNIGKMLYAPFDVILDKHTVVQPDI
ncbi:MAG: Uma2 family endonuclease, partial [Raineya sp.]